MSENKSDQERRLKNHLLDLYELIQVTNSFNSSEEALATGLEIIAASFGAEICFVLRYDKTANCLLPMLPAFGFSSQAASKLTQLRIHLDGPSSATTLAFQQCKPVSINQEKPLHSEMAAPLIIENLPQGVLVIVSNKQGFKFDTIDEQTFTGMAATLAALLRHLLMVSSLEDEKSRHKALLDVALDGFVEVGRNFRVTYFSAGAEKLTGWNQKEALGRTCQELLLPHLENNNLLCASCPLKKTYQRNAPIQNVEALIRMKNGEDKWVSCSYNSVFGSNSDVIGGVIALKDIHRAKTQDAEIQQHVRQLESLQGVINAISGLSEINEIYQRSLVEASNAIQFDLGFIHAVDHKNQELKLMAFHRRSEKENLQVINNLLEPFKGAPIKAAQIVPLQASVSPGNSAILPATQEEIVNNPVNLGAYACNSIKTGEPFCYTEQPGSGVCQMLRDYPGVQSYICVPIKTQDSTYGVLHLASYQPHFFVQSEFSLALGICNQIAVATERARFFEEIQQLARTDPMTGLYNKREFWERIGQEIKRSERMHRPLVLLMIDLDRLKWFNDIFGHAQGDILLSKIGELIRLNCRSTDTPFRYGGDELCLLLGETTAEDARIVAERIRVSARQIQILNPNFDPIIGAEAIVTLSIGIAAYPAHATTPELLFERADAAMFRAKETGKDRVCTYDPNIDEIKKNFRQIQKKPGDYKDDRLTPPSSVEAKIEELKAEIRDGRENKPENNHLPENVTNLFDSQAEEDRFQALYAHFSSMERYGLPGFEGFEED